MVKTISFKGFKPELGKYRRVSEALYYATTDAITKEGRLRNRTKWVIASYFSCATMSTIEKTGVKFRIIQMPMVTKLEVNGVQFPIFDEHEAKLVENLFNGFLSSEYLFKVNEKNLQLQLTNMKPYMEKHIKSNAPWGFHSINMLRRYALLYDYDIPERKVKKLFGMKTWVFPSLDTDLTNVGDKGVKVSVRA